MLAPALRSNRKTASYKLLHYVRSRVADANRGDTYCAGLFMPASRLNATALDLALIYDALLSAAAQPFDASAVLMAAARVSLRVLSADQPSLTAADLVERAMQVHADYLPQAGNLRCLTAAVESLILRPIASPGRLSFEQRRLRNDLALVLALEAQVVRNSALAALGDPINLATLVDDRDQHLYLFCDRNGAFNSADIGEHLSSHEAPELGRVPNDVIKRPFDFIGSLGIIALVSPLLVMLYILIKRESGPALYSQKRVGRDGRVFRCWKFRSMVHNAEELLEKILDEDPQALEQHQRFAKLHNDPRITGIGRWLRVTSLDELPQLFNVLRGDMSLVGPRPIAVEERDRWGPHFRVYKQLRPGLTGPWQLYFRSAHPYDHQFGHVVSYARQWSLWRDIRYLIETLAVPFRQRGAY